MTEVSMKFLRRTLIAGGAAMALFAGFAAPTLLSATAQEINPGAVAPPSGAPMSFANLIERVRPAVVSISVRQRPGAGEDEPIAHRTPPAGAEPGKA